MIPQDNSKKEKEKKKALVEEKLKWRQDPRKMTCKISSQ